MHLARYQVEGSEAQVQVYYFLMFAQIPMTSNIQYRGICYVLYLFHKKYLINIEARSDSRPALRRRGWCCRDKERENTLRFFVWLKLRSLHDEKSRQNVYEYLQC